MTPKPARHSTKRRVLITGATGTIGREIITELVSKDVIVRALTRRPETVDLPASVEVVTGDLTVPESLDAGLQDVDVAFLVWTAPPATVAPVIDRLAEHVSRVVFLSSPHQTPHPFFQQPNPSAVLHASIEREIAAAGLQSTILRPGMFAPNAERWWASQIREGDVVQWPYAEAASAPVDARDIAAVAAHALCSDVHAGADYVLTGPESLTHAMQVSTIGSVIGRDLRFDELSPDAFRRAMAGQMPPVVVDMLLNAWAAAVGLPAFVTSTVADITGRPARTFRQWVADHVDVFHRG